MRQILKRSILFLTLGLTLSNSGMPLRAQLNPTHRAVLDNDSSRLRPLIDAIEMNVAEVALGRLAMEKSRTLHVKAYAELMIRDHSDAISKLRAIENAPLGEIKPSPSHQAEIDKLAKMFGDRFEREYINAMVSDHTVAVSFFEDLSNQTPPGTQDNSLALRKVAEELVPMEQQHLKEAKQVQEELAGFLQPETVRQGPNVFSEPGTAPGAGASPAGNAGSGAGR